MSYVRVSILGALLNEEKWSINPTFDPSGEFPSAVDQVKLDAAGAAIAALNPGSALLGLLSAQGTLIGTRVEVRDDVTDQLLGITIQNRATPLPGSNPIRLPAQAAVVGSLRTSTPGGSGRGRVYWPALGATVDTSGRLSSPLPSSVLTDLKVYMLAIRSALATAFPLIGFDLAVRSRTTHTTPHVVRLQVGNVIDTQRRRRDTLPEAYQTQSFP